MLNRFYEQLARDYACSLEEVKSLNNIFSKKQLIPGRRRFWSDDYLFKVVSLNGKAIFCAEESVIDELAGIFENVEASWLSLQVNLDKLNEIASRYGYRLNCQHHYYLPKGKVMFDEDELNRMKEGLEFKWYEQDELSVFKGDKRFNCALTFLETAPDVLCLTASLDGKILGMSGASRDCEEMWQVGINVDPSCRGRNIGPLLTIMMKEEIIRRGRLPFYGTAESHIQSQKVGLKSGFFPTWWEITTEKCIATQ